MAVSIELANELKAVLGRLRAARGNDPKHGTVAGAPDCDDRCQICFNEVYFDYLIDQIPRAPVGTVLDGSILGEAISQPEGDVHVTPILGVQFIAPWTLTQEPE